MDGRRTHRRRVVEAPRRGHKPSPLMQLSKSLPVKIAVPALSSGRPGADFYRICNQAWLSSVTVPSYLSSYSVSEELEETLDAMLLRIAQKGEEIARIGSEQTTDSGRALDAVGRLVLSVLRPEVQAASVGFTKRGVRSLACMRDATDVARTLGSMIRYAVPTLLSVEEGYHEGTHTVLIRPGVLGLPDPRYYNSAETGLQAQKVLNLYSKVLKQISQEFDLGVDLSSGISVEAEHAEDLYKASLTDEYVVRPFRELEGTYKHIPWDVFFTAIGFQKRPTCDIQIMGEPWLKIVNGLFHTLPLEHWYLLLSIHTVVHALPYLPSPFDTMHYELYEKQIEGAQQKTPQTVLCLQILKTTMGPILNYLFVQEYLKAAGKTAAERLVRELIAAAARRLEETEWLQPATRRRLAAKVRAMRSAVYYDAPNTAPKRIPALQTDMLITNIYLLNGSNTDRWIEGLPTSKFSMHDPAFTVNAYYAPEKNQLLLPAGSFFWPFFSPDRLGWNYGGIGAIIAHEITHAFDLEGKEYDEHGREKSMWTATDEAEYKKRVDAIVRLFNQAKVGGLYVNGRMTASENLADLGGLGIALDALKKRLGSVGADRRRRELRDFFWSYAVSWRTKTREQKLVESLYTDVHAPPQFRVNYVVAQFDEWYEVFDVQTGDAMYIPPEERLRIF